MGVHEGRISLSTEAWVQDEAREGGAPPAMRVRSRSLSPAKLAVEWAVCAARRLARAHCTSEDRRDSQPCAVAELLAPRHPPSAGGRLLHIDHTLAVIGIAWTYFVCCTRAG